MNEFGFGYYDKLSPKFSVELYGFYGFGKGELSSNGSTARDSDTLKVFNYKMSTNWATGINHCTFREI